MNQPNPKVEAIVAEAVKIGFIDKDEGMFLTAKVLLF